jgi:cytochrome c553
VARVEKVPAEGLQSGEDAVPAGLLRVLRPTLTNPPFNAAIIDFAIGRGPDADHLGGDRRADRADEGHRLPAVWECSFCHSRGGDAILGIDYLQLSTDRDPNAPNAKDLLHAGPFHGLAVLDLDTLKRQRLVTMHETLATAPSIAPRGDGRAAASERAMLGYFHGNCGHCHNPHGAAQFTGLRLRFDTTKNAPGAHDAITTPIFARGRPLQTKIYQRMLSRAEGRQMPPIGTHVQDAQALQLLAEWINSMPPRP